MLRTQDEGPRAGGNKSPRVQGLIDDMFETMQEYAGIGLAAPQVHEGLRLFVAGLREADVVTPMTEEAEMPFITVINPDIVGRRTRHPRSRGGKGV